MSKARATKKSKSSRKRDVLGARETWREDERERQLRQAYDYETLVWQDAEALRPRYGIPGYGFKNKREVEKWELDLFTKDARRITAGEHVPLLTWTIFFNELMEITDKYKIPRIWLPWLENYVLMNEIDKVPIDEGYVIVPLSYVKLIEEQLTARYGKDHLVLIDYDVTTDDVMNMARSRLRRARIGAGIKTRHRKHRE